jgi:carbon monoxide dehydrogenase subunit G
MEHVTRSLSIKADPARVIEYVADVENHPAFIPPLTSVTNVSGDPKQIGTSWDWTFVMAGVQVLGRAETVEYEDARAFGFKTSGIESTFTYRVEPEEGGSRLTVNVDYEVPASVLASVANRAVVVGFNERESDNAARNLQTILE